MRNAVAFILATLLFAASSSAGWEANFVSSGSLAGSRNIALNSSGQPHITFVANKELKLGKLEGGNWTLEKIGNDTHVAGETSIAIDSGNNFHVTYLNNTDVTDTLDQFEVKYAKWDGTGWTDRVIFYVKSGGNGTISLDSAANPHLTYFDQNNWTLKYSSFNVTWSTSTVPNGGDSSYGPGSSIAIDTNTNTAYLAFPSGAGGSISMTKLKCAKYSGVWTLYELDSMSPLEIRKTAIAIDGTGNPHIAYTAGQTKIKYAKWTGVDWSTSTLWTSTAFNGVGDGISIAINRSNNPVIIFNEDDGCQPTYRQAAWNGTSWDMEVFATQATPCVKGQNSLAIDTNNTSRILYSAYNGTSPSPIYYAIVDSSAPSPISTLSATAGESKGQVRLSWTSPGDDGSAGTFQGTFFIAYSSYTINFTTTGAQITISTSVSSGSPQVYLVSGLMAGTTYSFRLWAKDNADNFSSISNDAIALARLVPEICGDRIDNDDDGSVDEVCNSSGEICGDGFDNDSDGQVDEGCSDVCGDGLDNDEDGRVDEGCADTRTDQTRGISNYPNPFSPLRGQTTQIRFVLNQDGDTRLRLYDLLGGLVLDKTFPAGQPGGQAGANEFLWDGKAESGRQIEAGAYLCLIESGSLRRKTKVLVR